MNIIIIYSYYNALDYIRKVYLVQCYCDSQPYICHQILGQQWCVRNKSKTGGLRNGVCEPTHVGRLTQFVAQKKDFSPANGVTFAGKVGGAVNALALRALHRLTIDWTLHTGM